MQFLSIPEFLMGLFLCAIFVFICIIASKLGDKKKEKIRSQIPAGSLALIDRAVLEYDPENRNFLVGKSYIYDIKKEGDRYKLSLLFHHEPKTYAKTGDSLDFVYMDQQSYEASGLKIGDVVTSYHNAGPEYQLKISKIVA